MVFDRGAFVVVVPAALFPLLPHFHSVDCHFLIRLKVSNKKALIFVTYHSQDNEVDPTKHSHCLHSHMSVEVYG